MGGEWFYNGNGNRVIMPLLVEIPVILVWFVEQASLNTQTKDITRFQCLCVVCVERKLGTDNWLASAIWKME